MSLDFSEIRKFEFFDDEEFAVIGGWIEQHEPYKHAHQDECLHPTVCHDLEQQWIEEKRLRIDKKESEEVSSLEVKE